MRHAKDKWIAPFEHLLNPEEEPWRTCFFSDHGLPVMAAAIGAGKKLDIRDENDTHDEDHQHFTANQYVARDTVIAFSQLRRRDGDPAIAANTEGMPNHHDDSDNGQAKDVPRIKTEQGGIAGFASTNGDAKQKITDQRNRFEQVRASDKRITNAHVPAQDVASEI